jgi:hypothetical protein
MKMKRKRMELLTQLFTYLFTYMEMDIETSETSTKIDTAEANMERIQHGHEWKVNDHWNHKPIQ